MAEIWDIYDREGRKTGRTHERGVPLAPGDMHFVVQVWLHTPDGRWLCSKRSPGKNFAGFWETTGGAVTAGEDSAAAALREVKEELGLDLDPASGRLLWRFSDYDAFNDVWLFDCPFTPEDVTLQPRETCDARLFTSEEILRLTEPNYVTGREAFMCYTYTAALFALFDPPVYNAAVLPRGTDPDRIDWSAVPAAPVDHWLWREEYAPHTEARLCMIEDGGIALRMSCRESDPVARHTEYGDEVWVDSAMECFLAARKGGDYINVEMNSAGNRLVGVGPGRENRRVIDEFFPCPPVKATVLPGEWHAETYISEADLQKIFPGFECKKGTVTYGNFFKVGEETGRPHYGMWSTIISQNPDFHRPEYFSKIIFA